MPTDKEFENFFREQLTGLEEAPPPMAWKEIREEIKPRRTYTGQIVSASVFFLIGIAAFFGLRTNPAENNFSKISAKSTSVSQVEKAGRTEVELATPTQATKPEEPVAPAKSGISIPGTERNSVYKTYLAVKKNAAKDQAEAPVLKYQAKQSRTVSEVSVAAQTENSTDNYLAANKQEGLKIAEQTSMELALETATENGIVDQSKVDLVKSESTKGQKDLNEAITETFGHQAYPVAIADTVEQMVLVVPYTVPEQRASWFSRFKGSLRNVFSSGN